MAHITAAIRTLAVAFWVGGSAALDLIDAPVRFGTAILTRTQGVALGQLIFTRQNRVAFALAVIALAASFPARSPGWTVALLGVMLALVTVQTLYLTPAITRLAQGLDFVHRAAGDPRYAAIRPLHTVYAMLEVVVILGGAVLLAAWARPGDR